MSVLSFGWGNLKLSFNTNERSDFKFEKRSRQGDTGLKFSSMTTVYSQLRWKNRALAYPGAQMICFSYIECQLLVIRLL